MIIDSHHHFWTYNAAEFGWITDDMAVLRRDYLPAQLEQTGAASGVTGAITVQARTCLEETGWLLDLGARHELIRGVVGWVPLKEDSVGSTLDRLAANPLFRGVREVIQGAPDAEYFDCPAFHRGMRELTSRGIPFDLLIFHHQLPRALQFVDAHPNQRFIVDHIAKPEIRPGGSEAWARDIRRLARRPNVFCKFSGVTTEVRESSWDADLIRPYFETVLKAFGPDRLMFGSDWPVCLLKTEYARWLSVTNELIGNLSESERDAFYRRTAAAAYGLKV